MQCRAPAPGQKDLLPAEGQTRPASPRASTAAVLLLLPNASNHKPQTTNGPLLVGFVNSETMHLWDARLRNTGHKSFCVLQVVHARLNKYNGAASYSSHLKDFQVSDFTCGFSPGYFICLRVAIGNIILFAHNARTR